MRRKIWTFARLTAKGSLLLVGLAVWVSVPHIARLSPAWQLGISVALPFLIMVYLDAGERARSGGATATYDALVVVADMIRVCGRPKTFCGLLAAFGGAWLFVPGWWHMIERNANTINALATTIYCVLTFYLVLIGVLSVQATIEASRRRDAPEATGTAERPLTWRGMLGDVLRLLTRRGRH